MAKKKKDLLPGRFPQKELPETEAAEAGSGEIILPKAFSARMQGMLTDDEYGKFVASYEKKRRLSLRINPLKVSRNRFQSLMEEDVEESLKNNRLRFFCGAGAGRSAGFAIMGAGAGRSAGFANIGAGAGRSAGFAIIGAGAGRSAGSATIGAGAGRSAGFPNWGVPGETG